MFFSRGIFRPLSLGDSISSDAERAGTLNVTVTGLLLIKENQISQVKEFRAFYVWEDARV